VYLESVQNGLDYVLGICKCLRLYIVHKEKVCNKQHLLPCSVVLPGSPCSLSLLTGPVPCQPPMCPMLTLSLPSGHHTQEMSLNTTHIRTCTRPSSSTCGSSRLSLTAQFLSYRHYRYSMTCASYLPWPIPNSGKICKQGQHGAVYNYAKYTMIT